MRLRIIPITIATTTLLLGVKVIEVTRGTESLLIPKVAAQQSDQPPKTEDAAKPAEAPASTPAQPAAPPAAADATPPASASAAEAPKSSDTGVQPLPATPAPASDEKKPEAKPEAAAKEGAKTENVKPAAATGENKENKEGKEKGEAKSQPKCDTAAKKNPNVSDTAGDTTEHHFTAVEVELLQNLSKRREELNRWDRNVQIKETALDATEKRVNDKIAQIEAMKKEVSDLLAQYNTQEDAKIKSLVKIYENMKSKDAARIFDELEMPVLLLVLDKMSEKKTAPILAEMNPLKAKQITVQLAEQRKVNTARLNTPTPPKTAQQ